MQTRHSNARRTRLDNVLGPTKDNILSGITPSNLHARAKAISLNPLPSKIPADSVKQRCLFEQFKLKEHHVQYYKDFRCQRSSKRSKVNVLALQLSATLFDKPDAGEYQEEIFNYIQERELSCNPLSNEFLGSNKHEITSRMRYILINWLVEVHTTYKLTPESLYLTVALLDRYIEKTTIPIKKDKFQTLGLASFYIATKFEEIFPPDIHDLLTIADNSLSKKELKQAETEMLKTLEFHLSIPPPILFLRRLTSAINADQVVHNLAKYFLELTIQEYELAHLPGNVRAAMSTCLAKALVDDTENLSQIWSGELEFLSGLDISTFIENLRVLARAAYRQNTPSRYRAIHNKYAENDSLGNVASTPLLRSVLLERIADLHFEQEDS